MKHTVELVELKSGAKGLSIDVPDASVTYFEFNFRAGDYLSPKNKWDTAHIMEHLVLGANGRYKSSADFSREFDKNGAYSNASTGTYHMSYIAECADFESERILDLLCVAIESPLFLDKEFDAEKANVHEELKSRRNNNAQELALSLGEAMGQCDLPYSKRTKQLAPITVTDIKNHYAKTHTSTNMRFVICGDISAIKKQIIARIESLAIAKGDGRIPLPIETLKTLPEPIVLHKPAVENIYYRFDFAYKQLQTNLEADSFNALQSILLGSMHSRIFGEARSRGLAYGIGYDTYETNKETIFTIAGQVLASNIEPLFKLISTEFIKAANGELTQAELDEAKQRALGIFKRNIQTISQLHDYYTEEFYFRDKVEDYFDTPKRIAAVTLDDIVRAANRYVDKENKWGIGFAGATNEINTNELQGLISKLR